MTSDQMISASQLHARAVTAFNQHDWRQAAESALHLLSQIPDHAGSHYIAGVSCLEMRQLAPALQHLQRAAQMEPARADFLAQLARALSVARRTQQALATANRAQSLLPSDPMTLSVLGKVFEESNAYAAAAKMFHEAAKRAPDIAHLRYNLATSLITLGDIPNAESEIEACLALDPQFWKAHLALAHLRRQSTHSNHLQRLHLLLTQSESDHIAKMCLHMALSKEYEDLAMYDEAFEHLRHGKAEGRKDIDYAIGQDEVLFSALQRALPTAGGRHTGDASIEPIFVFGMPRTGTTLIDRILSSHPAVFSAGELQNFGVVLRQAWGTTTPIWLDTNIANRTQGIDWQKVGAAYIASTRPATGHTPRFIDKLPHNFLYAGFIAQALPNAKMICLRRDPVDTCLSNFRQLFAEKLPYYHYSFDLLDTGKYYVLFDQLMKHWQRVSPGRIFELRYEDLIAEQESSTHQLLDFCELEWNDACMHFEKNPDAVGTASALQVREPLYTSSVKRWKHYEPYLADLLELLESAGIEFSR